jgi:hypothetical protein
MQVMYLQRSTREELMRIWMRTGVLVLLAGVWPSIAFSEEGIAEISQACADNTGCFPGDTAGLPVTITTAGSYALTGNLVSSPLVPNAANAIEIRSDDVSLDLRGFSIRCLRSILPAGPCKGLTGTGDAIEIVSGRNVRIANGTVRDFPQHGINGSLGTTSYSLDGVRAINNGVNGIDSSGGAQILRAFATDNGQYGILLRSGPALVLDAFTAANGIAGLRDVAADPAIGRGQFRDGTSGLAAASLLECIVDGAAQVCP